MKVSGDLQGFRKKINISLSFFAASLLLAFLPAGVSFGAGGDLIWQDVFNLSAGGNEARTVAASGDRVFAGGMGEESDNQGVWILRAYQAESGKLLWDDVFNPGGGNAAVFQITAEENRAFAAGAGDDQEGTSVWIVRAYDEKSGDVIWEDLFKNGGRNAEAHAVSAGGNRVFVGGRAESPSGGSEWVVRAYDASTGDLLWHDRFGINGKDEVALSIAVLGNRLFVSGGGPDPLTAGDWLVRAYDAGTGELLWEDQLGTADGNFISLSITARDGRVFAAGIGKTLTSSDWIVRAYDASAGGILWEDRFDTGLGTGAVSITSNKSGVFATGGIASATEGKAMIVKSYNPANGDIQWEDRVDFDESGGTGGTSVGSEGGRVYAAGSGSIESSEDWIVRSYDSQTGEILWGDQFNLGDGVNLPFAIAAREKRVYAVGGALANVNDSLDFVWLVRAYETGVNGGGGGGGCSISPVESGLSIPLYLLLPVLILATRLRKRLRT